MLPGPANAREVRVVALSRSGHHAVIDWLRHQAGGRYAFLNDCQAGESPFLSCQRSEGRFSPPDLISWDQEAAGKHTKRALLIYNYEDQRPAEIASADAEASRERWVGTSARRFDLLVLRDPFNLLASRLRWAYGYACRVPLDTVLIGRELWKIHAREYLGDTAHLPNRVNVSYNAWFADPEYRRALAKRLGVTWTDRGIEQVARWGPALWGDSFDNLTFDGRASEMKVLERWKVYADDVFFRTVVQDEELVTLSERIFGTIPGIERLFG